MAGDWQRATRDQYDDDTNLAARQALFGFLTEATPMAAPLSDLSVLTGQRVLDVGCGNGLFLTGAAGGGARAVGLDLSYGMATAARSAASAPVAQADVCALPVPDGSIDTVLALWMLYHVVDKLSALAECRRVLAPDGTLVASTNSGENSDLDNLVCEALAELLGEPVDHWHPPLDFTAENGAPILGTAFTSVETHPFGNTFEVTDPEAIVRYVGSLLGAIAETHPTVDGPTLLTAVGHRCERLIATDGSVRIERAGAIFLAR